ncbi:T9SS-dependent M36 family metallopeptidase [Hyunsoonleella sp. 2307UL5-6]|uniref:T9SS-dependent M36 family metallopeptidase n=1 Tax=Hyunsoonleella sp. 2307UL5-6 TaxID=3384768 RepID=UPI0039BD284C
MKIFVKKITLVIFVLNITCYVNAQSELNKSKYGGVILNYLKSNSSVSKASNEDIKDVYVNRENFSKKTGIANVYLNQRYKGVKIFNAITTVGIKEGKVFHYADNFKTNLEKRITSSTVTINEVQAIQKAATFFNAGNLGQIRFLKNKGSKKVYSKGALSQEPIPVELVYAETKNGDLVLSYDLSFFTIDSSHWWSVRVNAKTGEIINHNDWVTYCNFGDTSKHSKNHNTHTSTKTSVNLFKNNSLYTPSDGSQYNVFALPVESPSHGSRSIVTEPASATASPFGWHDTDGAIGPEFTITRGNNVWSLDDIDTSSPTNGFSAEGGSSLNFNFPLDFNDDPHTYLDVSTTNLFYLNNMLHDILYQHGFDEVSGNYQENNYDKGGLGEDYVLAQTQDGSSLNNAKFSTPPDGGRPRLEMYLFDATGAAGNSLTINNGPLAGDYTGFVAQFGEFAVQPLTSDLVLVVDDDSNAPELFENPYDACDIITNAAEINGKIAVVEEGLCFEDEKIKAIQDAGAIGVIVVADNGRDAELMTSTLYGDIITIPSIMIENAIGTSIIDALKNGENINVSMVDAGPYPVDGTFDNVVATHEYVHGVSFRLTGGADTVNCLRSKLQMGEGWSDWFGLMVTMKATDNGEDGRGIATFSLGEPTDGRGFRGRRYSTDFNVNEYTYGSTNNHRSVSPNTGEPLVSVHYIGSIWCTMLWDLTWAYIDKYGFDPDMFNGNGGNNKVMRLVIEGMKLQPCNPEFIEGRDAILAADVALTGGENQCLIWDVFANRGLGINATGGSKEDVEDQVENFEAPPSSDPSLANCSNATLSTNNLDNNNFIIHPNPASSVITITTSMPLQNATITLVDVNGRKVLTKEVSLLETITLPLNNIHNGLYFINIKGDTVEVNQKIIISRF